MTKIFVRVSNTESTAVLHEGDIGPGGEACEIEHEIAVTVESEEGGAEAEDVEDSPDPEHVLDGQVPRGVDDGVGEHEGVTGGEGHAERQVDRVELEAGGEAQDHRD